MTRPAVGLKALVEEERGRWVVYLDLSFWRESGGDEDFNPLENVRQRIRDYATRREAEVAAHWIERTADRTKPHKNLGF
jgi:hypothetical protein